MDYESYDRILRTTHVFILRTWVETREIQGLDAEFRCTVQHVNSGENFALRDLNDLPSLILSFFQNNETGKDCQEAENNADHK